MRRGWFDKEGSKIDNNYILVFFWRGKIEFTLYVGHHLAYCTSPGRRRMTSVRQSVE
jgi:hypothetical protein